MNRPAILWLVAIGLVAISATNIGLLLVVGGPTQIASRAVRFGLTCVLAFFLLRGTAWARYVAFFIAFLSSVLSFIGAVALLPLVGRMPPWLLIWGFLMGGAYGVLGLLLVLSDEIRIYFRDGAAKQANRDADTATQFDD